MSKPVVMLLLITGTLLTVACKKVSYHQLSEEDMTWLVYENNQVDEFSNGSGATVKYVVGLRTKTYNDYGDVANEFTAAYFSQLNDTTALKVADSHGELRLYKQDNDALNVTLSWPHFPFHDVPINNLIPSVANINGILYPDIVIIDGSNYTNARFYNKRIWYSKSAGVVQYEDTSGNIWVRN